MHSRTGDGVGSGSGGTTDEIPFPTALHRSGSPEATGMGAGGAVEKPRDGDGERTWGWGRESGDGGAGMGMEERGWGWRSGDGILHRGPGRSGWCHASVLWSSCAETRVSLQGEKKIAARESRLSIWAFSAMLSEQYFLPRCN